MKTMTPPKRRQVILVAVVTLAVLVGLWFGLISGQQRSLRSLASDIAETETKLDTVKKTLKGASQLDDDLAKASEKLDAIEEHMATGDRYSWVVNAIKRFMPSYKVEVPNFGQPVEKDTTLLPKFPYRQVTVSIAGMAFYHDLGEFVAGWENQLPYGRIENLEIEPVHTAGEQEREKLTFRMDIVTLVKPGS